ncbi:hypothetical protein [Sphingomonas sanxanigenens]|uniref:Uncharacterized protein n=1 Tax=Sphingomonas sanxanigenens DSM 19645 = NX02 TaxID=1123269 RepID=W0AIB0_9SPHN|nr:hypothetical protein [Sphingomonas sanxanigenens]AHE56861.1 hypothetical protein NX02_26335 [Sphingomonas sanxanigenens DSM 19645 = NX02]
MSLDGAYDCITKSPLGEQKSVFTVISDGSSFTGTNAGDLGSLDVIDGKVDGNQLSWKMEMTSPFPMTLDCTATIEGDSLKGTVSIGAFGSFPMIGTRQ